MAVPRTDEEGSLTPDPDVPADRTGPSRRVLLGVSGGLVVVIVACLGVLGVRYAQDTDPDEGVTTRAASVLSAGDAAEVQAERERVMRQARQFVLRVFTYGPDDLEGDAMPGYVKGVQDLITPKFAVDFDKSTELAVEPVKQAGYARSAEVSLVGVRDLGEDAATVMVSGTFTSSYPPTEEGQPRQETAPVPLRLDISLVRTGGEWLVDDFVPVTTGETEDDGSTAPTDPSASTDPSAPATTAPSTGQGEGR